MKTTVKIGVLVGVGVLTVWAIPPLRHAVSEQAHLFVTHYRTYEAQIRAALMAETDVLTPDH